MSPERQPHPSSENNPYGFTERERSFDRISHRRLQSILNDPDTLIVNAEITSNTFGEFLFIATKRAAANKTTYITFWGLGFHDCRERWLRDEWFWYEGTSSSEAELPREDVLTKIEERYTEITASLGGQPQSNRAKVYEMLADLTDEDGALTEMEDMGNFWDDDDLTLFE